MKLISFLGTGNYNYTVYTWDGQEFPTHYVAQALEHFFHPQEVQVFVTKESQEKHWPNLQECLQASAKNILIPSGQTEAEIWDIFDLLVSSVSSGEEVIFDITHAFRSLPLLVLLGAAFLQKARNVTIAGVYYGALGVDHGKSPIFDLTPAIKLLDWLTATDKLITTGSASDLGDLLTNIQRDFYTKSSQKNLKNGPKVMQSLGKNLTNISRSIELIRPFSLATETSKLKQNIDSEKLTQELGTFAKPFELLLTQIQTSYSPFAYGDEQAENKPENVIISQLKQMQWYAEKGLAVQAVLLAREWVITVLCLAQNLDIRNSQKRDLVEKELGRMLDWSQNKPPETTIHDYLKEESIAVISNLEDFPGTWSKLTSCRNDIAHPEYTAGPKSPENLQKYAKTELIPSLFSHFPQYQENLSP